MNPPQCDILTNSVSVVNVPLSKAHPLITIVSPLSTGRNYVDDVGNY